MKQIVVSMLLLLAMSATAQRKETPAPCGPVPTENQLRWQDMEMYAFIHYSMNTYTDQEWGFGNEDLQLFNPSDLDCRQWARVCKQAGMKGIIFTAKHHCGFCMWPSKYTEYSVKNTPWKQGKGDVVRELADACREEGLKFAVYLSPWDRNHAEYGRPAYVTYFRNQLRELLTNYGDIFEVWFDGANGGDGWYGGANETRKIDRTTYYEWPETYKMIRELQPNCLIWNDSSDRGDLRWVGTEAGNVGETNWSLLNHDGEVTWPMLHYGLEDGDSWVPGETNTSIRPGWFYHETENEHVKSLSKLMDTYYKSVGRNSTLLLNFPIAPNGRIHPTDSLRGIAFNKMIHEVFKNDLTKTALKSPLTIPKKQGEDDTDLEKTWSGGRLIDFLKPTEFNRLVVEEDIRYGQRVKKFSLEAEVDGQWIPLKDELVENGDGLTTIGHRRIICFPTVTATRLRFTVIDVKAAIEREQSDARISSAEREQARPKVKCDPIIKRISVYLAPELTADIPDSGEKRSSNLHYFFSNPKQMMIDWDTEQTITAFRYLPPQTTKEGTVTHYTLWASTDWTNWTKVASGEFSNIVNNPIWQTIKFEPVKAKILRLDADRLAEGDRMAFGDIEVTLRSQVVTDDLSDEMWHDSEWICVADAPEVTGRVDEDSRAADGANWFVSTITNEKKVVKATWITVSLGVNELYVNGQRIGREVLRPGFSHHSRTKYSFTYDVTKQFLTKKGAQNTLAAQVTPGWWADKIITPSGSNGMYGQKCAFRGVLELTFSDGTKRQYGTNTTDWKAGIAGPVVHAAIFDGEEYDARIPLGFLTPQKLSTPAVSKEFKGIIVPENGAEIYHLNKLALNPKRAYVYSKTENATEEAYGKIVIDREYKQGETMTIRPGEHLVIDFGQNCAAVPSFRFSAKEGTRLTCLPAELLNDGNGAKSRDMDGPEGSIHRRNLRIHEKSIRLDYTFAGSGRENYTPRYTFFGYRYVDITATDEVVIQQIQSIPVSSITPEMETGTITTGNKDINQLISNTIWGMRSNYLSVPTDCPQRNERLGWMADTQVFSETGTFFADTRRFFHKWMNDVRDSQSETGAFPGVAPLGQYGNEMMRLGWADAGIIVPWTIWKQYDDISMVEENWEAMNRFMSHVNDTKYDHLALKDENGNYQFADWLSYEPLESCSGAATKTPEARKDATDYWSYLGGCYWLMDAEMMRDMAQATGRNAETYQKMADTARAYLKETFIHADGTFKTPVLNTMQTPALFALRNRLVEGEAKENMITRLRQNFADHGNCLQTGFLGTSILMPTLTDNGMSDIAYTLLFQRKNPSWLYSIDNGATTIWERWNSYMKESGMGPNGMNSFNHYAYGAVCQWIWQTCAGIASDPAQPGFKHIIMKPIPDPRLGHLDATYPSAAGLIESHWKYQGDEWIWTFTIPKGASASVTLPGKNDAKEYAPGTYTLRIPLGKRFCITGDGKTATIVADEQDFKGVIRAANDLSDDIRKVTGVPATLLNDKGGMNVDRGGSIVVGTIGKSRIIDRLIKQKKLDIKPIKGKWEAYVIDVIDGSLVIAGNDKRGTIYGIYEISRRIGVSPWYWMADAPIVHKDELYYDDGYEYSYPAVKYRGIFINDEWPSFGTWCQKHFGGVNSKAYEKIFELLLRLKANYFWPAMWATNFNEDDPESPRLADEMGIVMGTSHHEPMMRSHREYLKRKDEVGPWDYASNPGRVREFFREGMERNKAYDNLVTIGMRGDGDVAMGKGDDQENMKTLKKVIDDQRKIIKDIYGRPDAVPQLWAIFTEVQRYYDAGFTVPDDVTLLFCDNNWGYIRRKGTDAERKRKGGLGLYYHIDMNGGPWNDRWVNTTTVPKLREQLNLAYKSGINRIWIINVGDLKPKEMPISFIMDYAWRGPAAFGPLPPDPKGGGLAPFNDEFEWLRQWTASVLGGNYAQVALEGTKAKIPEGIVDQEITDECAKIIEQYSKLNLMRKPEVQVPGLFNYEEMLRLNNQWQSIVRRCERLKKQIPSEAQDAFYQLVYYPAVASAGVAMMYNAATMGDRETVNELMDQDRQLTDYYNKVMAGGKWDGMMLDNHIGYTKWSIPDENKNPMDLGYTIDYDLSASKDTREYTIAADDYQEMGEGWMRLPGLGRGDCCIGAVDVMKSYPKGDGPVLEYDIDLSPKDGKGTVAIGILPTQDVYPARGLRLGVQIDDWPMATVDARQGFHDEFREYTPQNLAQSKKLKPLPPHNNLLLSGWKDGRRMLRRDEVFDNIRWLEVNFGNISAGKHRLKLIMIDPEIVVESIVVNPDNNRYSYFGKR